MLETDLCKLYSGNNATEMKFNNSTRNPLRTPSTCSLVTIDFLHKMKCEALCKCTLHFALIKFSVEIIAVVMEGKTNLNQRKIKKFLFILFTATKSYFDKLYKRVKFNNT